MSREKKVKSVTPVADAKKLIPKPEFDEKQAIEKQQLMMQVLSDAYSAKLDSDMEKLHNQFVAFISAAKLPLPQTLLVLQILVKETIDEAYKKYLGE